MMRRAAPLLILLALAGPARANEDYAPLVERLRPAVVNIQAVHADDTTDASLGSGFFVDASGLILTNQHVVEAATDVRVILADRRTLRARVIGRDNRSDLALLRVERAPRGLITASLGDSDSMRVGEPVIAIGNPFGLGSTVTAGILSATERNLGAGPLAELLQTDAPINPGSSGGPLFNSRGEVIGISTAVVENGQGIGFAIPANTARGVLRQLRDRGYVVRGYIGVDVQDLTPELARAFRAPASGGALVAAIERGSPAARAGLGVGDVIVEWNGRAVDGSTRLPRWVSETSPGTPVHLTLLRKGVRRALTVRVTTLRDDGKGAPPARRAAARERPLGIDAEPRTGGGLIVTRVDPEGALATSLAVGDEILDVNHAPASDVRAIEKAAREQGGKGTLLLRVRRDDTTVFVPVDL